jgi:hypothetical protein
MVRACVADIQLYGHVVGMGTWSVWPRGRSGHVVGMGSSLVPHPSRESELIGYVDNSGLAPRAVSLSAGRSKACRFTHGAGCISVFVVVANVAFLKGKLRRLREQAHTTSSNEIQPAEQNTAGNPLEVGEGRGRRADGAAWGEMGDSLGET